MSAKTVITLMLLSAIGGFLLALMLLRPATLHEGVRTRWGLTGHGAMCSNDMRTFWPARSDGECYAVDKPGAGER